MEYGAGSQSEFNMAFSYFTRLGIFFFMLAEFKSTRNLDMWLEYLSIIYTELSNYYKTETAKQEAYNELKRLRNLIMPLLTSRARFIPSEIYWGLIDLELNLRNVMKQNHMELKMTNDPRLAI